MFAHTDTKVSPWYVVNADNKKQARLNCIAHLLLRVPYNDLNPSRLRCLRVNPIATTGVRR